MTTEDEVRERRLTLRRRCTRFIHGHRERSPADVMAEVAEFCRQHSVAADRYGEGELVGRFEAEVAARLGKAAAVFMPTGTMAQQIALRIWCDRAKDDRIGLHATSHMELHERRAYAMLHGLRAAPLGERHRVLRAADVERHPEALAAVAVELPAREIGGLLPSWSELEELKRAVAVRGAKLHMDGARLWECGPYYERSLAEICAGFDSVYVSFYKGLDGIAGCALAGPADFVAEARSWQKRHGGTLFSIYPYVAAAQVNMERHLPRFPQYRERALQLARALTGVEGLVIAPAVPHVNMMHVFLRGTVDELLQRRDTIASERGFWLAGFVPADLPGWSRMEVYVGDQALGVGDAEVVDAFRELLARSPG